MIDARLVFFDQSEAQSVCRIRVSDRCRSPMSNAAATCPADTETQCWCCYLSLKKNRIVFDDCKPKKLSGSPSAQLNGKAVLLAGRPAITDDGNGAC